MKKILSVMLLIMAMLCLGATKMEANSDYGEHFYLIGDMTGGNWTSNQTAYLINNSYNSVTGKYFIEVNVRAGKEYRFALYNTNGDQYGPLTDGSAPNTVGYYGEHSTGGTTHSWKYTPRTNKIWICINEDVESTGLRGWYPLVWVEEHDPNELTYIDANGDEQICTEATTVTSSTELVQWAKGWYVVRDDVTITGGIDCPDDVNIILTDGATLTVKGNSGRTALWEYADHTLTIYGQRNSTGKLIASSEDGCAAIGGKGSIIINGGTIQASGGGKGAGIGAGTNMAGGSITINGGNILATGGQNAAGIGSGEGADSSCGTITINGGNITANSGSASGIGAGVDGVCTNIAINGGSISAYGGNGTAIKTYSYDDTTGDITVGKGVCIYSDENSEPTTLICDDNTEFYPVNMKKYAKVVTVKNFNVSYIDADGSKKTCETANVVSSSTDQQTWTAGWYVVPRDAVVTLSNGVNCSNGDVHLILADRSSLSITSATDGITALWVGSGNKLYIYGQEECSGMLSATSGYSCSGIGGEGDALVINGGIVKAQGGELCPGIGSSSNGKFGTITINRGYVYAYGGSNGAAGIGTGNGAKCGDITINGGDVVAAGGDDSAQAIGKGNGGNCGQVLINTELFTYGGTSAEPTELISNDGNDMSGTLTQQYAAIYTNPLSVSYIDANGKEQTCSNPTLIKSVTGHKVLTEGWYVVMGSDVNITDGVDCTGDVHIILADGAKLTVDGVEGERNAVWVAEGNSLTIYGQTNQTGALTATSGQDCAGIGSTADQSSGAITINGGVITATGGDWAAGIGSGHWGDCSGAITINGGNITATGGNSSCGIGCGYIYTYEHSCGTITINGGVVTAAAGAGGTALGYKGEKGSGSVIVSKTMGVFSDDSANPSTVISNTGENIISQLGQYATIYPNNLHITAGVDGVVKFKQVGIYVYPTLSYTRNLASPAWIAYTYGTEIGLAKGETVYFRARGTDGKNDGFNTDDSNYARVDATADIEVGGSLASLVSTACDVDIKEGTFINLFRDCTNLSAVTLDATTKIISKQTFKGCTGLITVNLPRTLETICDDAFADCSKMKYFNLHSVPAVAESAFTGARSDCSYNLTLDDDSYVTTGTTIPTATKATYSRNVSNTWGTIVLPYDIKSGDDYQLYTISNITTGDNGVIMVKAADKIAAGTPCIFSRKSDEATTVAFTATNSAVSSELQTATPTTGWTMNGTYTALTNQTGMYFIAKDKFWLAEDAISINPFRAWLTNSSSDAKAMTIQVVGEEDTDGIGTISNEELTINSAAYNIAGQRVGKNAKGIMIINGKKVLVK